MIRKKSSVIQKQLLVNTIERSFNQKMITIDDVLCELEIFDMYLQKIIILCQNDEDKIPFKLRYTPYTHGIHVLVAKF